MGARREGDAGTAAPQAGTAPSPEASEPPELVQIGRPRRASAPARATRAQPTTTGITLADLASAALPLARNLAALHLPVLRAESPAFASWAVTESCNLKCAHCSMNRPLPDELDHEQRLEVARRLARSEAWGVSLIGGEPLLVKGLFEYARILKAGGKRVFLGTSGERLDRHVDELLDVGLDYLTVSFEGHTAAEHDAFRGRAGLFERVSAALETLSARRRGGTPRLQVRLTLNRHNFRTLAETIDYWLARVDNVLVQIVQDNCLHEVRDRSCLFQPEDRPEFERVYAALRARYPFLRGQHYDLLARYVFEPEALHRDLGFRCLLVPATSIVVEANGRVKLCHGRADSEIGNVLDAPLARLWKAERADAARTSMQSRDYGCMCWESAFAKNLELVQLNQHLESLRDGIEHFLGRRPRA
jgi:MoaA/NifB/PqqE/SkfB family radical SAM enzyme